MSSEEVDRVVARIEQRRREMEALPTVEEYFGSCKSRETILIQDIKRVTYSEMFGGIEEYHILDWDEDKQEWTNACRGSYHTTWQSCGIDDAATSALTRAFEPIATDLGVPLSASNARTLVLAAVEGGPGPIGSCKELLEREPYPGEQQRREIPALRVDVYQRADGALVLLREADL